MEPIWLFSATDQSIDVIGAFIFAWVAYRSISRLLKNNITVQGKILLFFIFGLSLLHVFQVLMQVIYGGPLGSFTFHVWDIINYITAVLFIMWVERIELKEVYDIQK